MPSRLNLPNPSGSGSMDENRTADPAVELACSASAKKIL
jgi:hypothetical protein